MNRTKNQFDLTEGSILNKLLIVALPIIGTQVIQMTYNLTDMFWLGRLGSAAVAASGTVGMYMWLSNAFAMFGRMGAEIGVAQNTGKGNIDLAQAYSQNAISIAGVFGVMFMVVLMLFRVPLVGFFNIIDPQVEVMAQEYLLIVAAGIPFTFLTASVTGSFNGSGNSRIPFYVNGIGLILNMILDPLLIFNAGMGIRGAAIATVTAQIIACLLSLFALIWHRERPFEQYRLFVKPEKAITVQIFKWAVPISIESFLFTFLSMMISRLVAAWGANAMAVHRINGQLESLSWLIAGGFSSALTAFMGQNYGAGRWERIRKSFRLSTATMAVYGVFVTFFLYFGAGTILSIFLPGEYAAIAIGVEGLKILALCQFVGCVEAVASGAFKGIGQTLPPSVTSATCNALRVALAFYLSNYTSLGLSGIWWAITIGAIARGVWLYLWYLLYIRNKPLVDGAAVE